MRYRDFLKGAALGAGLLYMLDSNRWAHRRAFVRGKLTRMRHKIADAIETTALDPTARLLVGSFGAGMTIRGIRHFGWVRTPLGAIGSLLLARSLWNVPVKRPAGKGAKSSAFQGDDRVTHKVK